MRPSPPPPRAQARGLLSSARGLLPSALRALLPAASALLAACSSGSAKDPDPAPPAETPLAYPRLAAPTGAQRLTSAQYRNVIRDVFGAQVVVPPALDPDTSQSGFLSVGASFTSISDRGIEEYETAAYSVASQAMADDGIRAKLLACTPSGPGDEACARQSLAPLGRRLWRRPLEDAELATLGAVVGKAGTTLGDFNKGFEFGIAALLQSSSYLFRPAVGEVDPASGERRYTALEMATRLSFFLTNSGPDDELLDAAAGGDLLTDRGLAEQAQRLLALPAARGAVRNFFTEYLGLDSLLQLSKDPKIFTTFSPEIGPAAREETLRLIEYHLFDIDADYRDLFTTHTTFVNPKLASMYEVPAPDPVNFARVELPDDGPRRGLLGHLSFLALNAHPVSSSATLRGKFIRTRFLCNTIPSPPVNVNTALPEPTGTARTLRERVQQHLTDPSCKNCHLRMDPIGLGFENFDGIGRFRTKDNGAPIDASGDLDGAAFTDALSLGQTLHDHPDVGPCLARNLYRYATSFAESAADEPTILALAQEFRVTGYKVRPLMLAIALSPAFRLASEPR
jgi:hypothetical protein